MHAGTNTAGMQYECQASKQAVTSAKGLLASSTTTALRAQTIEGNCFTVGRPAKCKLGVNLLQKRSIKNLLDFVSRAAYRPRERNLSVTPRICPIMPNYAQCYRLAFSLVSQSCRFFRGLASLVLSIFFDEKSRWVTACLSFLCLLKPVAIHADDLTDEAEGWVADMLNDIEYGLGSYYVDYRVTIETSPDSINWVNSKGELSQFYDEDRKIRINNASWVNSSIGGDYIPQSGEAFRRGSFHVTIAELNSERYVLQPVIDEGLVPFNPMIARDKRLWIHFTKTAFVQHVTLQELFSPDGLERSQGKTVHILLSRKGSSKIACRLRDNLTQQIDILRQKMSPRRANADKQGLLNWSGLSLSKLMCRQRSLESFLRTHLQATLPN